MGLASEMKNLSEEILASFKQRIKENEELVNDVQKTLDGFRKDHQEMASVLNANAMALRKDLAHGEKERMNTYHDLMKGIHQTISSIQKEVVDIQSSTFNMINEFSSDRSEMAAELDKFFVQGRTDRKKNEKTRMKEFDTMMKGITNEIRSINEEVLSIFKNTNEMLEKFDKEHTGMSAELRAELGKNLAERVEYTRALLSGFQKRLSDIGKENQKMAQNLRKDLAKGENNRISEYNSIMKGIHADIKGIRKEVKEIQKYTSGMLGDLSQDRSQGAAEWNKMQDAIAKMRETGTVAKPKAAAKKVEKKEVKAEAPIQAVAAAPAKVETAFAEFRKETKVEPVKETPVAVQPKVELKPEVQLTLEEKVLLFISRHPKGVKVAEMEEPMGETRMKLGFIAKKLLDEGKVQKMDNVYFPIK